MVRTTIIEGDITRIPADVLITLINPYGAWLGGVDRAIYKIAGNIFHRVPQERLEKKGLEDGQTIWATPTATEKHEGAFRSVLFIVDDLEKPLYNIVRKALNSVLSHKDVKRVTMPVFRTGVMLNQGPENSLQDVFASIKQAIDNCNSNPYLRDLELLIVVYNDTKMTTELKSLL